MDPMTGEGLTFGEQLRLARKAIPGLDQGDIAKAVGVTQPTVSGWERGDRPDRRHLPRLARALGFDVDDLRRRYEEAFGTYNDGDGRVSLPLPEREDDAADILARIRADITRLEKMLADQP